jgi:hypothetical protein
MNVLEVDVPTEAVGRGAWRFYAIGDPHLDALATDRKRLEAYIAHIAADPHSMWVLVGDMLDGTTPSHRWFEVQAIEPTILMQMDRYISAALVELEAVFSPLKGTAGIILQGNHDMRKGGTLWSGLAWEMARRLEVQYGGDEVLIRAKAPDGPPRPNRGATSWTVHAFHGAGGGLLPGGKINRHVRDMSQLADADIYVRGHVHDSMCRIQPCYSITQRGTPRLITKYKAFITAPAFWPARTENLNSYPSRKGYPPSDEGLIYLECLNPRSTSNTGKRMVRHECPF